jgi:hypothetical protein
MVSWPPHAPGGSSGTSPWAWTSVSSTSRYGADPVNQPCLQSAPHVVLRGEDQWPWLVDRGRRPAALIGYIWPAGAGRAALAKVFHAGQTRRAASGRLAWFAAAAPCAQPAELGPPDPRHRRPVPGGSANSSSCMLSGSRKTSTAAPGTEFAPAIAEWATAAPDSRSAQASSSSRPATLNAR